MPTYIGHRRIMDDRESARRYRLAAGQGWRQFCELGLAFVLSSLIGLERQIHQKAAGLRTHTLVGTGAALFLLSAADGSIP